MAETRKRVTLWGPSRKSSHSNGTGGACVSAKAGHVVATGVPVIGIEDTKLTNGPTLVVDRPTWTGFLAGL